MKMRKQVTINIAELDKKIGILNKELDEAKDKDEYYETVLKIEQLADLRIKLAASRDNNSVKSVVVGGALSLASLIVVLQFEDENVITTKAFNMIPSLFKGSK